MSAGVPAGATMPNQKITSTPGIPCSAKVGTEAIIGAAASEPRRLVPVTAMARALPACSELIGPGMLSKIRSTTPDCSAVQDWAPPGYGMCDHVDLGDVFEHLSRQMMQAADAGRAVVQLAGIGFGVGDELLEVMDRQVRAHREDERAARDLDHRRKRLDRIVRRLLGDRRRNQYRARAAEHDRVAVRIGPREGTAADGAAGAGAVLDHDRLAQIAAPASRRSGGHRHRVHCRRETARSW